MSPFFLAWRPNWSSVSSWQIMVPGRVLVLNFFTNRSPDGPRCQFGKSWITGSGIHFPDPAPKGDPTGKNMFKGLRPHAAGPLTVVWKCGYEVAKWSHIDLLGVLFGSPFGPGEGGGRKSGHTPQPPSEANAPVLGARWEITEGERRTPGRPKTPLLNSLVAPAGPADLTPTS